MQGATSLSAQRARGAPDLVAFRTMALRESLRLRERVVAARLGPERADPDRARRGGADRQRASPGARSRPNITAGSPARLSIPLIPFLVLPLAFATKKGRRGLGILVGGAVLAAFHHGSTSPGSSALAGAAEAGPAILGMAALPARCSIVADLRFGPASAEPQPDRGRAEAARRGAGPAARRGARLRGGLRGRTLASYLAWRLATWTLAAAAAIVALLQMVDLFDRGEEFVARGMGFGAIAYYAWLRLPPTAAPGACRSPLWRAR